MERWKTQSLPDELLTCSTWASRLASKVRHKTWKISQFHIFLWKIEINQAFNFSYYCKFFHLLANLYLNVFTIWFWEVYLLSTILKFLWWIKECARLAFLPVNCVCVCVCEISLRLLRPRADCGWILSFLISRRLA